jgi:UDP-N-acetylmuramoyl-tripeptide--D-alanyl-D-alanine ligase
VIPIKIAELEPFGELLREPWADEVTGVQIDSRRVDEGDLFVAVFGGRDFVKHAFARGAAAVLLPHDEHAALAWLGRTVRTRSNARVVGITGSTGKTSTKDILAALCAPHVRTIANEGNFNQELGVPLTLCRIEPDTEVCISEMGMRGLGEIAYLAEIARPDIALITNVGPVHLELVETVENVARAKAELVAALPPRGIAIVPDDPLLEPFLTRDDIDVRRFGTVAEPGVFEVGGRTIRLRTNLAAPYHQQNLLAALHVADALGVLLEDGDLQVELSALRGEELQLPGGGVLINDCYNANPVSMRAALAHLAERGNGHRRVAVLGDMAELGRGGPGYHREVGEAVRELGVDELVAIGELARGYVEGAAGISAHWVPSVEEGVAALRDLLRPGDVVLVKGSRAMGLEAVAANLVP